MIARIRARWRRRRPPRLFGEIQAEDDRAWRLRLRRQGRSLP